MKATALEIKRIKAQEDIAAQMAEIVKRLDEVEAMLGKLIAANKPAKAPKAKSEPVEDQSEGEG